MAEVDYPLEEELFEALSKNKGNEDFESEHINLIVIFEDILYTWNPDSQCLLVSRFKDSKDQRELNSKVQKFILTNPPLFEVTEIILNASGSVLAVCGQNGVVVVELPRLWGEDGYFENGKSQILCKSWNIAERLFICNSKISLNHITWHPYSKNESHIIILTNDNYLRVFDIFEPFKAHVTIALGNSNQAYLTPSTTLSFSNCLGDSAICFDLGIAFTREETNSDIWLPIYVLNGNGDVFKVYLSLETYKHRPSYYIQGPITMYPSVEDNFGVEASSLICLNTNPSVIIIATSRGIIHHAIALVVPKLPVEKGLEDSKELNFQESALYVYESVELSLKLTSSNDADDDIVYSPLKLHKDPTNKYRYFGTHRAGVHTVSLPFIQIFEDKFKKEHNFENLFESFGNFPSISQHVLCTKPFPDNFVAPLLGLQVFANHISSNLIALLASWDLISLPIRSELEVPNLAEDQPAPIIKTQELSLDQHIRQILQKNERTPMLKFYFPPGSEEPSAEKCEEFLDNIIERFENEYLKKRELAQAVLERRAKILLEYKVRQNKELDQLKLDAEKQIESYNDFDETYRETKSDYEKIVSRFETVLQTFERHEPNLSEAEIKMQKDILNFTEGIEKLETQLVDLKKKKNYQAKFINKLGKDLKSQDSTEFTDKQKKYFQDLFQNESDTMSSLIKQVKYLQKVVD